MAKTTNYIGAGASDNWSEAANWSLGVPDTGDTLVFGVSARYNSINDLAADKVFEKISFAAQPAAHTISGNRIEITLEMTAPQNFSNDIQLALIFNNAIALKGNLGYCKISGLITGNGSIIKDGTGTWQLTNDNNSFSAQSEIKRGRLIVTSIKNVGLNSALGNPPTAAAGLVKMAAAGAAYLEYVGAADTTTDRIIELMSITPWQIHFVQNGAGKLVFTSSIVDNTATNKTLILEGTGAGTAEIRGIIPNPTAGTNDIVKNDAGTWLLTSIFNRYTGGDTINAGTLTHTPDFLQIAISSAWKTVASAFIVQAGTWKEITNPYTVISNAMKLV